MGIGANASITSVPLDVYPSVAANAATEAAYFFTNPASNGGRTYIAVGIQNSSYETDIEQNNAGNTSNQRYGNLADSNIINSYSSASFGAGGGINFITHGGISMVVGGGTQAGNVGIGYTSGLGGALQVNGNVGIGTTTPVGALTVMNGNVGIGTWVPGAAFQVNGAISSVPNGNAKISTGLETLRE